MNLETPNRAFVALLAGAGAASVLVVSATCAALGMIGYRLALIATGSGALASNLRSLVPAVVFAVPVTAGLVMAVRSIIRQVRATKALAHRVDELALPTPVELLDAARSAGVDRVELVDGDQPYSFAFGLVRPRVVLSRALAEAPAVELGAVLAHERYHITNLDPLKLVVTRTLSTAFFYLPVLRDLHRRDVTGRELAADRRAIALHGRNPLAAALFRVVAMPTWPELGAAAAMAGADVLDVRVEQLETGREPVLAKHRLESAPDDRRCCVGADRCVRCNHDRDVSDRSCPCMRGSAAALPGLTADARHTTLA